MILKIVQHRVPAASSLVWRVLVAVFAVVVVVTRTAASASTSKTAVRSSTAAEVAVASSVISWMVVVVVVAVVTAPSRLTPVTFVLARASSRSTTSGPVATVTTVVNATIWRCSWSLWTCVALGTSVATVSVVTVAR